MTFDDIIDFLLSLMRDDDARAAFEQDPQGTLATAGLQDVTGQDIRDARLQLADSGAVRGSGPQGGGGDAVHEIGYTTRHFSAASSAGGDGDAGGAAFTTTFIDQSTTITVDDRDITLQDSFNETTIVNDSFNSDSFNSDDDVTAVQDNSVDNSVVNNDVTAIQDNDTVLNDNDVIDIEDNDVVNQALLTEPEAESEPVLGADSADALADALAEAPAEDPADPDNPVDAAV